MADHFISINRGIPGTKISDFTQATSSTTGDDLELRLADAIPWTKLEVIEKLKKIQEALANNLITIFPSK